MNTVNRILYKVERNCGRYVVVRYDRLKGIGDMVYETDSLYVAKAICKEKNNKLKF